MPANKKKFGLWAYSIVYNKDDIMNHALGMCNADSEEEAEKKAVATVSKELRSFEMLSVALLRIQLKSTTRSHE